MNDSNSSDDVGHYWLLANMNGDLGPVQVYDSRSFTDTPHTQMHQNLTVFYLMPKIVV